MRLEGCLAVICVLCMEACRGLEYTDTSCANLEPLGVKRRSKKTPSSFEIRVTPTVFQNGSTHLVEVTAKSGYFTNVMLITACNACGDWRQYTGVFKIDPTGPYPAKPMSCMGVASSAIRTETQEQKTRFTVLWSPLPEFNKKIQMRASIVQTEEKWWRNVISNEIVPLSFTLTTSTSTTSSKPTTMTSTSTPTTSTTTKTTTTTLKPTTTSTTTTTTALSTTTTTTTTLPTTTPTTTTTTTTTTTLKPTTISIITTSTALSTTTATTITTTTTLPTTTSTTTTTLRPTTISIITTTIALTNTTTTTTTLSATTSTTTTTILKPTTTSQVKTTTTTTIFPTTTVTITSTRELRPVLNTDPPSAPNTEQQITKALTPFNQLLDQPDPVMIVPSETSGSSCVSSGVYQQHVISTVKLFQLGCLLIRSLM